MKFKNSCYFMSKERLNWQQSREVCQKKSGDLVVIINEHVQVNQLMNPSISLASLLKTGE